jgi:protease-4
MSEQEPDRKRVEPTLAGAGAGAGAAAGGAAAAAALGLRAEGSATGGWERAVLERLVMATVEEQRRARRWRIFFRLLTLGLLLLLLAVAMGWIRTPAATVGAGRHTAVVEIDGVLLTGGEVEADSVITSLRGAFKDTATAGVVLRINSPGGSPVQAGMIYDEIRRLRAAHPNTPMYAVVEEICASGGYYIASAADRIYVDKASLIGSIGVRMDSFGFTEAMDKLGIERRLITAGQNKGFLDPFLPLNDEQRAHAQRMVAVIHQQFIDAVRQGRGERLKESPDLFSGLVWPGTVGIELGLADGLGSVRSVAREVIKAENLVDFTHRPSLSERLARRIGTAAGDAVARHLGATAPAQLR